MRNFSRALFLAAIAGSISHGSSAQTAVNVSGFDIAGIKLRMPISDVAAVFKRLEQRDGGDILAKEEFEKALGDFGTVKEARYFGYSSQIYKIGVTLSPPYRDGDKSYSPSVIDVIYVINDYAKDSGARAQVLEKYGAPSFDNKITGKIEYCQKLISEGSSKTCDAAHGDTLAFENGRLYLSDKEFDAFTRAHSLSMSTK